MKSLLNHNFQTRISLSNQKFVSLIADIENPSKFSVKHERISGPFDPIKFFYEHARAGVCSIRNTKILHTHLLKRAELQSNIVVTNFLLECYFKSASMADARKLFDLMSQRNVMSWNIMISGYNCNSLFEYSWEIFCKCHSLGFELDGKAYGSILSACFALQGPSFGEEVYSLGMKNGFFSNGFIRARMIDLFAKKGSFEDALRVFHDFWCQNLVCWNAIISGAFGNGKNWIALDLFRQMCRRSLVPNSFTFSSILTACAAVEEFETGKGVQGRLIKCGAEDIFVGTALVDFYAKSGKMDEAVKQFSQMPIRNVVTWTAIISGFVHENNSISALKFFRDMRKLGEEINSYTLTCVISACGKPSMIKEAGQVHSLIVKAGFHSDAAVEAALINVYTKLGGVDLSDVFLREMKSSKNPSTWAAMASYFAQSRNSRRAIELFKRMLQGSLRPDRFCTSTVLSIIGCLDFGRQIHCYTLKTGLVYDVSIGCSFLTMYSKCGNLEDSHEVFQEAPEKDNVSWTSMIAGFAEHEYADKALKLFREMLLTGTIPDEMILTAILNACSLLYSLPIGKEIHGYALRAGVGDTALVGGALVNMYSKCSALDLAKRVFDLMPQKDQVACSSLVSSHAQNGYVEEALLLFYDMLIAGFAIDCFTISSILGVIALLDRPSIGTQMHAYITKLGLESEVSVGSSLVTMYSKSGSIEDFRKAFDQIEEPDLIGWTALIMSYAQHGKGEEALRVYELMREEGIKPDSVTFVGVLSACSHFGFVEEAYFHLSSMAQDYRIEPGNRHYACMVDLLGRSGRLKEAYRFISEMPIEPDALIWGTLLAACKVHGDIELGKLAAQKVLELEPSDAGAYVSLSNICADLGQWEEVLKIRRRMKGTGVKKERGLSFL
ncbi:hypothetical protein UlMin_008242 [Ulmus minor]